MAAVFRCSGCGACCRGAREGIALSRGRAAAIARRLGLSTGRFLEDYCLESGGRLQLRRSDDGMCSLRSEGGCLAWELKPRACSLWPFPERLLADGAALEAVRSSCPGIEPAAGPAALERALRLIHAAYPA